MAIHRSITQLGALPDGLRVLQLPSNSAVAYCGIVVHAGTRNEAPDQQGLAHFCEHLSFKGTARRSATKIINDIEGLGGELNAFTNKEDTVFYCAIQREHLRRAVDVLCDIVFNSQYPDAEVEKEREVVCDEIESYEDSPADLIYDEFENLLFDDHPLGHNILGTSEKIRSYTATDARHFTQKWYRPENSVLFVSPPPSPPQGRGDDFLPEKNKTNDTPIVVSPSPIRPNALPSLWEGKGVGSIIRERGTHQAHVMMGTRAYCADDPRRWALYLLNNILGGPAMNSRLSLSLRERNGLVYTVESSMVSYSDTGMWSVYFGCDQADVKRCQRLVRRELNRLMTKPLSPRQLRAAKRQLQGQLAIASDNHEQTTIDQARTFLHIGHCRTLADVMAHIERLSADDLLDVARQLFAEEQITTLIYR